VGAGGFENEAEFLLEAAEGQSLGCTFQVAGRGSTYVPERKRKTILHISCQHFIPFLIL
jgi:hypothetical protein